MASVDVTFNTLLYVMVGGIGSISGPITGTFIVYGLSQVLQVLQEYQLLIFGPLLVLLVIFMPAGLAGALRSIRTKNEERRTKNKNHRTTNGKRRTANEEPKKLDPKEIV